MPAITGFTTGEILTAANVNQYLLFGNENRIINGDFSVNQRAFSSSTTHSTYGFDRWLQLNSGGTVTYSAQTFTVGNPITGQEPRNFARMVTSGQSAASNYAILVQKIESVRTLAGQTATISFWARASSGTPKVAVEVVQDFGTGGSPSANVLTYAGQVTLSTSWARHAVTFNVPSISGKTIGTNNNDCLPIYLWCSGGSDYNSRTGSIGIQNNTIEFWGVKVESGAVATPFLQRPQQVELALCQRYYQRIQGASLYSRFGMGSAESATIANILVPLWVIPRTTDLTAWTLSYSAIGTTGNRLYLSDGTATFNISALGLSTVTSQRHIGLNCTSAGLTTFRSYYFEETSTGDEWIAVSTEL